jgi:hypothetical protein
VPAVAESVRHDFANTVGSIELVGGQLVTNLVRGNQGGPLIISSEITAAGRCWT